MSPMTSRGAALPFLPHRGESRYYAVNALSVRCVVIGAAEPPAPHRSDVLFQLTPAATYAR